MDYLLPFSRFSKRWICAWCTRLILFLNGWYSIPVHWSPTCPENSNIFKRTPCTIIASKTITKLSPCPSRSTTTEHNPLGIVSNPIFAAISLTLTATAMVARPTANRRMYEMISEKQFTDYQFDFHKPFDRSKAIFGDPYYINKRPKNFGPTT